MGIQHLLIVCGFVGVAHALAPDECAACCETLENGTPFITQCKSVCSDSSVHSGNTSIEDLCTDLKSKFLDGCHTGFELASATSCPATHPPSLSPTFQPTVGGKGNKEAKPDSENTNPIPSTTDSGQRDDYEFPFIPVAASAVGGTLLIIGLAALMTGRKKQQKQQSSIPTALSVNYEVDISNDEPNSRLDRDPKRKSKSKRTSFGGFAAFLPGNSNNTQQQQQQRQQPRRLSQQRRQPRGYRDSGMVPNNPVQRQIEAQRNAQRQQQEQRVDAQGREVDEFGFPVLTKSAAFNAEMRFYGRSPSVGKKVANKFYSFKKAISKNYKEGVQDSATGFNPTMPGDRATMDAARDPQRVIDRHALKQSLTRYYHKHDPAKTEQEIEVVLDWVEKEDGNLEKLMARLKQKYKEELV